MSILPPLSLLALRCCISLLALRRTPVDVESTGFKEKFLKSLSETTVKAESDKEDTSEIQSMPLAAGIVPNFKNGQCMDMRHVFRKHVKPKKQHEINNLGQVVSLLSQAAKTSAVVDVGAGLGHLARLLAFQHNLRVTTIEAANGHAPKASEFDKDLRKNIYKVKLKKRKQISANKDTSSPQTLGNNLNNGSSYLEGSPSSKGTQRLSKDLDEMKNLRLASHESSGVHQSFAESTLSINGRGGSFSIVDTEMPRHVICTVEPNIAADQFLDIMLHRGESDAETSMEQESTDASFVLAGLHACGDLTPTLLRVFLNCPTARGLASVSCCYMKMTASSRSPKYKLDNFPMSSFLRDLPYLCLSYEAREMACHFADSYYQRLLENPPHLKSHSYRAALEKLLKSICPSFKSGQARITSKIGPDLTFYQYALNNLQKLGIGIETVPDDLMQECMELTGGWERVVAFYTLRLSLAPLVETLLLYDRALFLLENGVSSLLVPIFDPNISPRNFALLAVKH